MGSNSCRKNSTTRRCLPRRGIPLFKYGTGAGIWRSLEVEIMGRIWDRRGEEMAKLALFLYFVNSGKTIQFLCKLQLNTIIN